MIYNDNTVLMFGEHKFTKLSRVPSSFLLHLWNTKGKRWKRSIHYELLVYIQDNLEAIKLRDGVKVEEIKLCSKFVYVTKSEAKKELNRISSLEQKFKKPVRCYECPDCGYWHLTSKEN